MFHRLPAFCLALILGVGLPSALCAQQIERMILDRVQIRRAAVRQFAAPQATAESDPQAATTDQPQNQPTNSPEPEPTPEERDAAEQERLLERYEQARRLWARLRGTPYQPEAHDGRALLVLDTIEFGHLYDGTPKGSRFVVARLHLLNRTERPHTLTRGGVLLKLEGESIEQSDIPDKIAGQSFSTGENTNLNFSQLERPDELTVEPGQAGAMWVFFNELDVAATLPDALLEVALSGQPREINLKQQIVGQMGLEVTRIGPANALALFEISGRTNLAAVSILADQFDELVERKVTRLVVVWKEGAEKLDSSVAQFLSRFASYAGRETNQHQEARYPVMTQGLREVHLANPPGSRYSYGGRRVIHDDPQTAVAAAIWTALEILSAEDLIHEIRRGHPLIRAAALSAGGAKLAPDHLDLVLEHLRNAEEPLMQKAAAYALRHFGDPRAVEELSALVFSGDDTLTGLAVSSLSQSRYQAARDELRRLLRNSAGDERKQLARELAKSPAADWTALYVENVTNPDSAIRVESLQALHRLGYEHLLPLLKQCLDSDDEALRNHAFSLALNRNEPELESMLEQLVLERLATEVPDGHVRNYLSRTKNAAAVPLLIEQLKQHTDDVSKRQNLIQILSQIGDDRVAELFVELYDDLNDNEQSNVLTALGQMHSPRFLQLAQAALRGEKSSLIYSAMNSLSRTDSAEAERVLIDAFDEMQHTGYLGNLANILSQIGSPEAEAKLREGRHSETPEKRRAAINALRNLERRKPGYTYLNQARYQMRTKKWEQALEYVEMSLAIDDSYASAYATRGTIQLRLDKSEDAEKSYRHARKIDSDNGEAAVGLSRVLLRQGKHKEALEGHRDIAESFSEDSDFEVHSGIFFAELADWARNQDDPSEDREQRIGDWESEALQYLSDGFRHGYSDRALIQNAPELESLQQHAEYHRAMQGSLPERDVPGENTEPKSTAAAPED
jgi:HEAT repeat protein